MNENPDGQSAQRDAMNKKLSQLPMLLTVALVFVVVVLSWYRPISDMAANYVDDGLKRSLVSFASARALNGVISVLQGTQVVAEPLGFGVVLTLGEILDPINDLVEQFSTVMLTASVAFGIQKLLLTVGSNWMVSAFVTGIAVVWSAFFVRGAAPNWLSRLLAILLFLRFVMPVTMIGSAYMFEHFSAQEYRQSQEVLSGTAANLKALHQDIETVQPSAIEPPQEVEPKGFWDRAKGAVAKGLSFSTGAVRAKIEQIQSATERAAENIIRLIVIFLMQTIVVPIILLWGLYRLIVGSERLCQNVFIPVRHSVSQATPSAKAASTSLR